MDMQGSRALPVTQQQAWDALNDPAILKACVPGCDKFEPLGGDAYAVGAGIKVGPVSAKFTGKVQLSEIVAPVFSVTDSAVLAPSTSEALAVMSIAAPSP